MPLAGRRRARGAAGLPDLPDARACIPGPIATPSLPSIDAALEPDTADEYIYFLAIPDGGGDARLRQDQGRARREPARSTATSSDRRLARPGRFRRAPDARPTAPAWAEADRAARPARLARLRARFADAGVDAYFGVRREHMRYLTGFTLGDGEEKVAGNSGQFLVGGDEVVVLADSRYTIQARREAPDARVVEAYNDLPDALAGARGVGRGPPGRRSRPASSRTRCGDASRRPPRTSSSCRSRAGSRPTGRSRSRPSSSGSRPPVPSPTGRSPRCCPRSGRASTEADLALRLEWLIRTGGAEALAFDVACLAGPEAALPHGAPGDRPVLDGPVLLFDFGAQVAGYRSDMTRTLFVGEPAARDLEIYELVARAQAAAIAALEAAVARQAAGRRPLPSGRAIDAHRPRRHRRRPATATHFGHGTGHGIGLATHEAPSLGRLAAETPLPSPTVFSVEPGVYLDGEMGVRIEDLVAARCGGRAASSA